MVMARFKAGNIEVLADQYIHGGHIREQFVLEAMRRKDIIQYAEGKTVVKTDMGFWPLSDGDWIIQGDDGKLLCLPDEDFRNLYEPCK